MTTIRHVAAIAGVSIATASRALSDSPLVTEPTKQRVIRAAAELDYTPSRVARSLVTGLTGNIGVIVPDLTNPFHSWFLAGLESKLGAHKIGILIGDSRESRESEYDLMRRMSTQVDGLVLASSRLTDEQIVSATARLPVVLANRMLHGAEAPPRLSQMVIDVDPGFSAAVHHLHTLGHSSLTYVDGPSQSWSGAQKRSVLSRTCREVGMALTIVQTGLIGFEAGREAGRSIARGAATQGTTAVMTFNDQVALGVLSAFRDLDVAVPGRISIVGCDDSLPDGLAWPALTTVDGSAQKLGVLTAERILDPTAHQLGSVPTWLTVRQSTASPSAASAPE
ncbi:LacI family DNA-binding transcriptional regulator [Parafrigoribacterium mesophilum]|uniref:LacI family DNA-binding transcriptional regulator n=1 Tax=Parafrigoribacterium mesophilum TaxID=433646 RepID=UPI0031FDD814